MCGGGNRRKLARWAEIVEHSLLRVRKYSIQRPEMGNAALLKQICSISADLGENTPESSWKFANTTC